MFDEKGPLYGRVVSNVSRDWSQFPGLPFALEFEARFERDFHRQWLYNNWSVALYVSACYVITVLIGQHLMSYRKPYALRGLLCCWNALLAVFSICGTIKCLPEFVHILWTKGIYASFCESCYYEVCYNSLLF